MQEAKTTCQWFSLWKLRFLPLSVSLEQQVYASSAFAISTSSFSMASLGFIAAALA